MTIFTSVTDIKFAPHCAGCDVLSFMVGYNFIPLNIEAPVHKIFRRTFFWFLLIKNLIVCRELILKIDAAASSKFSGTKNVFHAPTDPTIDLIPILRTDIENNFAEPR